ncbi:FecR family protein [Dyadobacter aurulentus]|uniref:FecR family protein n=1 Tax=Dyadobacter sp. UC 10 TaxID=2605428 RepID=UPI0011F13E16|nr:FecR family protein [Dyadobacter sp. UC 10]KAA0988700.1 FecR family protein [Dyadobacter sp. UC 10]
MRKFNNSNLEDFLLDDEFRHGVWENEKGNAMYWNEITSSNPDKVNVMNQARELLLLLGPQVSSLTRQELDSGIAAILSADKVRENRFVLRKLHWLAIAASVMLILGIIVYRSKTEQNRYSYKETISKVSLPLTEVTNETGDTKLVNLPDGSTVRLSPSSRISYTVPFIQNKKREIYLMGEAYFDIHKDIANPLYVYTNGLLTRVVGTSFLIKTSKSEVKVLVRTGKVAVIPIKDIETQGKKNTEILLTPNQLALFSTKDHVVSKTITSAPLEIANTRADISHFENQPVIEVFSALEKAYGIPFVYDRRVMAKCSLRAEFTNESFFAKLDIITRTIGANYEINDGKIIVSGKGCN